MKLKLYNLLNEEGIKCVKSGGLCGYSYISPEECLTGFIEEEFNYSNDDENYYLVVFEHKGKFYRTEYARYELAGFTSWGEILYGNNDIMIEVDEVKKVTKTIEEWEEI